MGLYKSLERCIQLEMEKLKQLNDLIKEKKRDREEHQHWAECNKIVDEEAHQLTENLKSTRQAYLNRIIAKKKQLNIIIQ